MDRRSFVASIGMSAALEALAKARGSAGNPEGEVQTAGGAAPNPVWPRSVIVPIPEAVANVENPVVSLNGRWKFTLNPPARFWSNEANPSAWDDLEVPGECTMQGFAIARDTEYPFKRAVKIPPDFRGKKVFLRFDGLYSYGRVWVNGHHVRDHRGGFTSWDCDITPFVTPGEEAWLSVGVTDEADNISWQSNYAKHYIGGILRDVRVFTVPRDYVTRFHVETDFDSSFVDAVMLVTVAMAWDRARDAVVELRLNDPDGKSVPLRHASVRLSHRASEAAIRIQVRQPEKWDSEHPRLYALEAVVRVNGSAVQTLIKRFGFRKIEVRGNRLFVNGDPVKLHGGCRHDIGPTRGRSSTSALDQKDAHLLKDANFNFVRTSHYPPSEAFLEACDRVGLYIEEETAVCFVRKSFDSHVVPQDDPGNTAQFMNQFAEMIERDRDHPCVIVWSLGNESQWGSNFEKEFSFVKAEDRTRPVIFSYPESVPKGTKGYDIFSEHYPKVESDFSNPSMPKLNDEFGHLPCYDLETLRRDPGVRNYWGRSIREFWKRMFPAEGCLGGSVWASIDEVFMLPDACVGYGEWGIIDGWRREKPEYWLAKKAYSPVKIPDGDVENPGSGNPLRIPIRNEFNHSNLKEVRIEWRVGSERGEIRDLDVAPHKTGLVKIPGRAWRSGENVSIEISGAEGRTVDKYELTVGRAVWNFQGVQGPAPRMDEDSQTIRVAGEHFEVVFSKSSGLVRRATCKGQPVLEGGPILNLAPCALRDGWLSGLKTARTSEEAVIDISANYQRAGEFSSQVLVYAQFQVRIDGAGLITTHFKIHGVPRQANEIGVGYVLPRETDQLSWSRKSQWSFYPPEHIGRRVGVAQKIRPSGADRYRVEPAWAWAVDMKDFFLFGKGDSGVRGTRDFRSQKQDIWFASGIISRTGVRARAESEATHAVRAEIQQDGRVRLNVNSAWAYPDLDWGNDCPALAVSSDYEGTVKLRLTDNDSIDVSFEDR